MPELHFSSSHYTVRRHGTYLLDSNVLIAAFSAHEGSRHETAALFLDEDYSFLVPFPVVVETWGMLARGKGPTKVSIEFLDWLGRPSGVIVLPEEIEPFEEVRHMIRRYNVDFVDSTILRLARRLTRECDLEPPIQIATFDTRDFLRLRAQESGFLLYDLNALEVI